MISDLEREAAVEFETGAAEETVAAAPEGEAGGFRIAMPDLTFLKAKTGPGSIEDYVDHPFNRHGSRAIAQILRGATGIAGDLDYAIIDIGLGLIELGKERKGANAAPAEPTQ